MDHNLSADVHDVCDCVSHPFLRYNELDEIKGVGFPKPIGANAASGEWLIMLDSRVRMAPGAAGSSAAPGVLSVADQQLIVLGDLSNQLAQTQKALQTTLDHSSELTGGDMTALIGDARHSLRSVDRLAVAMQATTDDAAVICAIRCNRPTEPVRAPRPPQPRLSSCSRRSDPTLEEMHDLAQRSNRLKKSPRGAVR